MRALSPHRSSISTGVIALASVFALAAVPASALKAKTFKIPGVDKLLNVACPPKGACIATGLATIAGSGAEPMVIVPISHGKPGTAVTVPGTGGVGDGLACPRANYCLAVADLGGGELIVPIKNGKPGKPGPVNGVFLDSIGCGASNSCWADGLNPTLATTEVAHIVGTAVTQTFPLYPMNVLRRTEDRGPSMACTSATSCTLVGTINSTTGPGIVWTLRKGKVTSSHKVKSVPRLNDDACPSSTFCEVVGSKVNAVTGDPSGAVVLTVSHGKPGAPWAVKHVSDLSAVSCKTLTTCYAFGVGTPNVVVPILKGKPVKAISIKPHISSVACGKTSCVAVGLLGAFPAEQGVVYTLS